MPMIINKVMTYYNTSKWVTKHANIYTYSTQTRYIFYAI